jgi:hypothetical protein
LLDLVRKEHKEILAALAGLEGEINDLRGEESKLREGDLSLEDLESKYRQELLQNATGAAES